ncbi:MAG: VOC family protein [Acetobacteraceae bacterium]
MLDHVTIGVSDIERSMDFYDKALQPLGIARLRTGAGDSAGYGADGNAFFWIGVRDAAQTGVHIAFAAPDRSAVDRFHAAALAAGGRDHGAPGLRVQYHPDLLRRVRSRSGRPQYRGGLSPPRRMTGAQT